MAEKTKPRATWGQSQAGYLANLQGKQVTVVFTDGKAVRGTLTGVGTFEIFVTQDSGLELLVFKGACKYIHPTTTNSDK
jgi:sRNA-binding regulator protein Hfq